MVTFYNCFHGDCAFISDTITLPNGTPEQVKLYVDLGPARFHIPNPVPDADLLISHSDNDHCLGKASTLNPRRIFVPAFFMEMAIILHTLVTHHNLSIHKYPVLAHKFIPVDDGHPLVYAPNLKWDVFNPCRNLWMNWLPPQVSLISLKATLNNFLSSNHIDADVDALIELSKGAQAFYSDGVADVSEDELERFVLAVTYRIYQYANTRHGGLSISRAVSLFKCSEVNDYSIVFKFIDSNGKSFLFTGDAPCCVYTRNYTNKSVQSDVLKVPHHGSNTGFDMDHITQSTPPYSEVLNNINPKVMVVSHGDHKPGPPDVEVIRFLNNQQPNRLLLLTTDIVKNNGLNPSESYMGVQTPYTIHGINAEIR
jgi:hypothetical protein